jgi:hypothetical protein
MHVISFKKGAQNQIDDRTRPIFGNATGKEDEHHDGGGEES